MNFGDVITDGEVEFKVRSNKFNDILDVVYPIGSIFTTVDSNTPFSGLFGTWKEVSSGKVLQGSDSSHSAGTEIEAGLPNPDNEVLYRQDSTSSGINSAVYGNNGYTGSSYSNTGGTDEYMQSCRNLGKTLQPLDVYPTNPIYGKSTTVQPPAYVVHFWQRIA